MQAPVDSAVWDEGEAPEFLVLQGEVRADVCVVGLGGSGLSCLAELQRHDVDALGLDARTVGAGAAGRNAGILLAGLPDLHHRAVGRLGRARAAALYRATLDQVDFMSRETPELVERTGTLRIASDDRERQDCREQFEAMTADRLPVESYEGEQGEGLYFPGDGVVQPMARCRTLARRVVEGGARLFQHSPARSLRSGEVRTPEGVVHCRRVIVAVDGGIERLFPDLAGRVRSGRVQLLATAPERYVRIRYPVYARWGYDFWWQLPDRRVIVGGRRDAGGADEWGFEAGTTDAVQRQLNYQLNRLGVRAPVKHRWSGVIGFTRSHLPLFEEVREDVLVTGGYCGTGNVMGALLGREAARWAVGRAGEVRPLIHP